MTIVFNEQQFAETFSILESDLYSLARLMFPHGRPVTEAETRMASVILRRWVVDNDLADLLRPTNFDVTLPIIDNSLVVTAIKINPNIGFFMTGGVKFQGQPVMGIYDSRSPPSAAPELPVNCMESRLVSLREYRRQPRIFHNGQFFSCMDIIKFLANKGGGAHLSYERSKFESEEAAFRWCSFGGPAPNDSCRPKGALHFEVEPDSMETWSCFHVEVIAAASSFVQMQIGGLSLLTITKSPSFKNRVLAKLGLKKKLNHRIYERL